MLDLLDWKFKPIFLRMYFSLVAIFFMKLLRLNLIEHVLLGINIYHPDFWLLKWA